MLKEKRVLIFSGGRLGPWALEEVNSGDFLLGVDRGALFLVRNNIQPHYVLGDFDSVNAEEFAEIQQQCENVASCDPVMKDYTDTELAFNWALKKMPKEIVLLGAVGTRLDHTLANIHLLYKGLKAGIPCRIIDEKNEITVVEGHGTITGGRFTYVSLLPLTPEVHGITLEGFKYPLHQATLKTGDSLGVSNVLEGEVGEIYTGSGKLLVIKSMD
ncbi:MAG: thiamine diphosphokinase [Eubacteriales bacterium]